MTIAWQITRGGLAVADAPLISRLLAHAEAMDAYPGVPGPLALAADLRQAARLLGGVQTVARVDIHADGTVIVERAGEPAQVVMPLARQAQRSMGCEQLMERVR